MQRDMDYWVIISCLEQKAPNKSNRESLDLDLEACNGGYKYIVVAMDHFTQQVSKNWSWKDLCRLCTQVSSSGKWVGHYGTILQHPSLTDKALLYNWKQSKLRDFINQSSLNIFTNKRKQKIWWSRWLRSIATANSHNKIFVSQQRQMKDNIVP